MAARNIFVRFFAFVWGLLNAIRRVLHFILLVAIFAVLLGGLATPTVTVPASAALLVDPVGSLVEQRSGDSFDRALEELSGQGPTEALVADIVESLQLAAKDDRIKVVVMRLEFMSGDGLPKLRAVAEAIRAVRAAGKKVVTLGDSFTQDQYYLAAQGDEIYLNDLGVVYLDGYGYYRTFLKSALDKIYVDLNVFRVGEYKSFVEPFIRDDMSPEDRTAASQWLQALWRNYQDDVVAARKLPAGALDDYANNLPEHLRAANGSTARVAIDKKLVDGLKSRQEFDDYMIGLVGEAADDPALGYAQIDYRSYLAVERLKPEPVAADNVGIVVASGQIVDGEAPSGSGLLGGDTLLAVIREARFDDSIKAVVLRVDSPGGSMFASEVVADELDALKAAGKPLVVSMGSLAASGGYYIAIPADEIWAEASTITGSIGVGALIPTVDRGLDALGIHVDGFGTTRLAGQLRIDRPLGPEARSLIEQTITEAYRLFVERVARARDMEYTEADALARGRVWIGSDAKELGLVDGIGGLRDAVQAAARRAGLQSGDFGEFYVEPPRTMLEQVLRGFGARLLANAAQLGLRWSAVPTSPLDRLLATGRTELERLAGFNDPRGLYLLCACGG
jgi:protease-4